jgi:serine protease Do
MKTAWSCAATVAAVLVLSGGGLPNPARAQISRRTPIVEAVEKTRDAIVTIKVEKHDAFDRSRETAGTGVIVDETGYVVTSRHVIADASRIRVQLRNKTNLVARILFEDPNTDLAILRVKPAKPLPALPLGPGSDLMVGETVIAVGHPYGYSNTVSTGIISALEREITMPTGEVLTNLIQTDASINPGNSGGPLLNIYGELIGINAALRDGAQGIAFAVNAETVKEVLSRHLSVLRINGVTHGLCCSERVAPEGPARQHLVVAEVAEETPAALAGLKPGDEIRRVGTKPVANRFDIERALWGSRPGQHITLTVVRQGKEIALPLTLARGTADEPISSVGPARRAADSGQDSEAGNVKASSRP